MSSQIFRYTLVLFCLGTQLILSGNSVLADDPFLGGGQQGWTQQQRNQQQQNRQQRNNQNRQQYARQLNYRILAIRDGIKEAKLQLPKIEEARDKVEQKNNLLVEKLSKAETEFVDASREYDNAKLAMREALKALSVLENQLESQQDEASPFGVALAKQKKLKDAKKVIVERIKNTEAFKAASRLMQAKIGREALKKDFEYQRLDTELKAERVALSKLRTEIFEQDPTWEQASEAVRKARSTEKKTKRRKSTKAGARNKVKKELAVHKMELKAANQKVQEVKQAIVNWERDEKNMVAEQRRLNNYNYNYNRNRFR